MPNLVSHLSEPFPPKWQNASSDGIRPAMEQGPLIFSPRAMAPPRGLSRDERERFERRGWLGPYPLLTPEGVEFLHGCYLETGTIFSSKNLPGQAGDVNGFEKRPWFKSIHAHVPAFCEAASHKAIVNRLASILGPDIIAWGVTVTRRRPGQSHRWHVDVEHARCCGANVFIGLKNMTKDSSLNVISGSHHVELLPQALGIVDDEAALADVKRLAPAARLVSIDMKEGEFVILHGKLWHGSHNKTKRVRTAVLAQYSTPGAAVRIPLDWDEPIRWHPYQPPCILVAGRDRFGLNRLISAPTRQTWSSFR